MQGFDELANILNHRTHRRYLDKPVPDELLEVLLGAAFLLPLNLIYNKPQWL